MNLLIQIKDSSLDQEIREMTESENDHIFISHTPEDSINILSRSVINRAVISLKRMHDAAILKYLTEYYPKVEVVVIANETFDEVISIFRTTNYSVIHEPLRLSELKKKMLKDTSTLNGPITNHLNNH